MTKPSKKILLLRKELAQQKLDGFIVPDSDEHQNEYTADYSKRLRWLTGFSGSSGTAIVLKEKAAIVVDPRYTLQVQRQVNTTHFECVALSDTTPLEWIAKHSERQLVIGFDARLHTADWCETAKTQLKKVGVSLLEVGRNPIDAVWNQNTDLPDTRVYPLVLRYAGQRSADKRATIAREISDQRCDALILSSLDSIAWLFNIRASDVKHTPVAFAHAIVFSDASASLYIKQEALPAKLQQHLGTKVHCAPYDRFWTKLAKLGAKGKSILIDKSSASVAVVNALKSSGARIASHTDPCQALKAVKNPTEISGAIKAHIRDGVALAKFLHWFSVEAPKGKLDEIAAAEQLYKFRSEQKHFKDLSFETISAAGENAALPHYIASSETNRSIRKNELYLVDSGSQYLEGTTDVTRTVGIGKPGKEMRDRFTRVLQAHIALANARFPVGCAGAQLDGITRRPMWAAGLDYGHGTGHGVGSFLGVHEGPHYINRKSQAPICAGIVLSNEPGFYKEGAYGIRIENLIYTKKLDAIDVEYEMLGFENLTLVPIDRNLIDPSYLSDVERAWLNTYHQKIRRVISPRLEQATKAWLEAATEPI